LSALTTIIAVLTLSVVHPIVTNIIIHHQQQAFAIQGDSTTPTTNAACGQM